MWNGYTDEQQTLIARLDEIANGGVADRAGLYDREAKIPVGDIEEFHREGWLTATLDKDEGGLGYGFLGPDALTYMIMIERLAMVSSASSHCLQVHLNTIQLFRQFCNDTQFAEIAASTRDKGLLTVGAGSEPGGGVRSTVARKVDGGYLVNGKKHYATNATYCDWIWVYVGQEGGEDLQLAIRADSPGLTIDEGFWDPVGMRACVSPMLIFEDCFVPDSAVMAENGSFLGDGWLARINLGFTANYIGSLQGIYDWILDYIKQRGRSGEQTYEVALGEMKARIDGARLVLYNAVLHCQRNEHDGLAMANEAKYLAIDAIRRMLYLGGQVSGSTALFRKHDLERRLRDMHVHVLHKRHHIGASLLGAEDLGMEVDLNFS